MMQRMRQVARRCAVCSKFSKCVTSVRHGSRAKVPTESTWETIDKSELPVIDPELISHLERLSLVEFNNKAGVERLAKAIRSANKLFSVNVDDVEPLDTVLEDRNLYLREDDVTEGNIRKEILSNASKTEEDYFVSPPGNIPLKQETPDYNEEAVK